MCLATKNIRYSNTVLGNVDCRGTEEEDKQISKGHYTLCDRIPSAYDADQNGFLHKRLLATSYTERNSPEAANNVPLTDNSLIVDISDALSEKDKVKFTVHTRTTMKNFQKSEFLVVRQHEEFIWLHDRYEEEPKYAGYIIPPPPPRPNFDASREKLQRLGEGEGTMTKEEFTKMKQELEAIRQVLRQGCFSSIAYLLTEISLLFSNHRVKIGFVYRPPIYTNLSESLNMLENFLEDIRPTCDEIVVLGDFNINLLDQGRASELLLDSLDTWIVNDPTRKKNLINIIAISNTNLVNSEVIDFDMHGITDHKLVLCNLFIDLKKPPIKMKTYRDFKLFNFEEFERDLKQLEWADLYNANNIGDKAHLFTNKLIQLFDNHAPLVKERISKPKAEWYANCIKVMTEERNRRLSKYKHTKNENDWREYADMRNLVVDAVRLENKHICFMSRKIVVQMNVYSNNNPTLPDCFDDPNLINEYFIQSVGRIDTKINDDTLNYCSTHRISAMLQITDDILEACDTGNITALLLLVLSKAFDLVDHKSLSEKLKYLNFSGTSRQLEYLATFKKTVAMHEVFLTRLASHSVFREDRHLHVFLEYDQDLCARPKGKLQQLGGLIRSVGTTTDQYYLNATVHDVADFFEQQMNSLTEYHGQLKEATARTDKMTEKHKELADSYIKISGGLLQLANSDDGHLDKFLAKVAEVFEKARKIESRVASDQDLKLADTLRYYMRDSQAARALLVRRLKCLANYENANRMLEKARHKNKEIHAVMVPTVANIVEKQNKKIFLKKVVPTDLLINKQHSIGQTFFINYFNFAFLP
nr:unnamed protein product [Callosobruchus analis]